MALCDQADVETRLQVAFTANPEPVVTALIAAAEGHIERVAGRPLESASHVETFDGGRVHLFLRHWPVTAVSGIVEDGVTLTTDDFRFTRSGRLLRLNGDRLQRWVAKLQTVEVTYDGGYITVPGDIVDICAWMVVNAIRRGLAFSSENGNVAEGITQESLGDWSATYAEGLADPAALVVMTPEQRDVIGYYRIPAVA